jgi:hypothetical protein
MEWLLFYYPVHLAVELFLVAAAAILAFFLLYQSWNICQGHTAYEVHKHRQLLKAAGRGGAAGGGCGEQPAANGLQPPPPEAGTTASSEQQHRSQSGSNNQVLGSDDGSSQQAPSSSRRACAPYDRGVLLNWWEVMAPHSFMAFQQHRTELAPDPAGPQSKQKHS